MKKIMISIVFVFVTLITSILSYADNEQVEEIKKLSLEQAIQEGIKNSSQLKINDLDIQIKEIELDEARYDERKYKNSENSAGTVQGIQLDENMFSKKREYALEEEKIKENYVKEDIKYNVTYAYYSTLQAMDYMNVENKNLENIQRNRDIVKKKFDLGLVSKSDLIMADISLDESKVNIEKSKQNLKKAYRSLNMILNFPLDTKIELTSNFKEEQFNIDLNKDLEKAYSERFDVIQLNHNYELVKLDFETNAMKYPENTYVYKYKQRNVLKIENILGNYTKNIELDIKNKYDVVINSKKQIELNKSNIERSKEGLRLKELSYDLGMCTVLEVQQATNQLYNAQLALSSAISSYNLSILDYNKAVEIGKII